MNNSVYILEDRAILYVNGSDAKDFLQNLISNDINNYLIEGWEFALSFSLVTRNISRVTKKFSTKPLKTSDIFARLFVVA